MLQTAFPALPPSLDFVDVNIFTVDADPARSGQSRRNRTGGPAPHRPGPSGRVRPGRSATQVDFRNPSKSDQRQRIQITRVLVAPGRTTLEWTLTLARRPVPTRVLDYGPPVAEHAAGRGAGGQLQSSQWAGALRVARNSTCPRSGRAPAGTTGPRTSASAPRSACGRLGPAEPGRDRRPGHQLSRACRPATRTVDVEFPGFGTIRPVRPMAQVEDAATERRPAPRRPRPASGPTRRRIHRTAGPRPTGRPDTPDTSEPLGRDYGSPVEPTAITLPRRPSDRW